jgi:hypothetical protein
MLSGNASALQTFADPDPLTLNATAAVTIRISSIARLNDGSIQLGLQGTTTGNVRVQSSPVARPTDWNTLVTLPALTGSAVFTDTTATNSNVHFYRCPFLPAGVAVATKFPSLPITRQAFANRMPAAVPRSPHYHARQFCGHRFQAFMVLWARHSGSGWSLVSGRK